MRINQWASLILLCCVFISVKAARQEQLIFSVDVIRHGDRTPVAVLPKAPYDWPEGLGQLTPTGMHQEYQLGETLRKKYVEQYHLLSPQYKTGVIYVRSSDVDRTLMSAEAMLMGLYPLGTGPHLPDSSQPALPSAYQPIPIHTVAKDQETLLITWSDSPQFKELIKTYVYPTAEWKEKSAALHPKFAAWSEATGITITDLYQLKSLGDTLYINQLYHVPLPPNLSAEDAEQIIEAGRWVFVTVFKPQQIGKFTGHELLKAIADDLQQASEQKTPLKYKLYSGHDSNQLSLFSAMKAPLQNPPPYASDLNVSLFDVGHQNYYVKVTFNGEAIAIPGCGGTTCTLAQFKALVDN